MKKLAGVLLILLVVGLSSGLFFRYFKNPSGSMLPTLEVGDHFAVYLRYPSNGTVIRGYVVVYPDPTTKKLYTKRIVGLPDETVNIENNDVYINGEMLHEPYAFFDDSYSSIRDHGPVEIPDGEVFLLGDNRNASIDSRHHGTIGTDELVGKATRIYWARDKKRILKKVM